MMTMSEAAEKVDISISHYCNLENGKSNTSHKTLRRFAKLFGVKPEALVIGGSDEYGIGDMTTLDEMREYNYRGSDVEVREA